MTDTMLASAQDTGEGDSKKKLMFVAGGLAGLLVLGGAGFMLLSGGSSGDSALAPVTKSTRAASAPKAGTAKAPTTKNSKSVVPTTKVPATSTVRVGRDPFQALYMVSDEAAAKPGDASAAKPGDSAATGTDTSGNLSYTITLSKVTTDKGGAKLFTFVIGKETKTVLPAQRFGKYGELVVLTYVKNAKGAVTGAVIQVGDDNPVEARIGVKLTVQ